MQMEIKEFIFHRFPKRILNLMEVVHEGISWQITDFMSCWTLCSCFTLKHYVPFGWFLVSADTSWLSFVHPGKTAQATCCKALVCGWNAFSLCSMYVFNLRLLLIYPPVAGAWLAMPLQMRWTHLRSIYNRASSKAVMGSVLSVVVGMMSCQRESCSCGL